MTKVAKLSGKPRRRGLPRSPWPLAAATLAPVAATLALAPTTLALAPTTLAGAPATSARTLSVRDEGKLRYVESEGSWLTDEGAVAGTIAGRAKVEFEYNGSPTVRARFAIRDRYGTLRGHATCRLSNPNSPAPSFRGKLTLTGGSGRYAKARGNGELFGVYYRHSYGLTVQAIGRLSY